jgi:hypothetical protein
LSNQLGVYGMALSDGLTPFKNMNQLRNDP